MQKRKHRILLHATQVVLVSLLLLTNFNNCAPGFQTLQNGVAGLSSLSCDVRDKALVDAFETTFYAQARKNCASCHGSFQGPKFATTDIGASLIAANDYFDSSNVEGSPLYNRSRNGHCGVTCTVGSTQSNEVVASLRTWAVASLGAPSCDLPAPDVVDGAPPPPIADPPAVAAPPPIPPVIQLPPVAGLSMKGTVGIQKFSEIAAAMAGMTGIPLNTSSVQLYYDDSLTRMSIDGSADGITNSMLLTYTTMASTFCRELVLKEVALPAAGRKFYAGIDFTKNMAAITEAKYNEVISLYANNFWGRDPKADELLVYKTLYNDLSVSLSGLSAVEQSKATMLLTCTSALSSLDSIIN